MPASPLPYCYFIKCLINSATPRKEKILQKAGTRPSKERFSIEETIKELKSSNPELKQCNLKSYLISMKDHLTICFQRVLKKNKHSLKGTLMQI